LQYYTSDETLAGIMSDIFEIKKFRKTTTRGSHSGALLVPDLARSVFFLHVDFCFLFLFLFLFSFFCSLDLSCPPTPPPLPPLYLFFFVGVTKGMKGGRGTG
jgi:hypothetical protein